MNQTINSVKVVQDSITKGGNRMLSYEVETYRYIWAEVLTHKMLNKNAQSSRAVPVKSVLSINESDPVEPIVWGKNQAGMSSSQELEGVALESAKALWKEAATNAFIYSKRLADVGLAKMWSNRITEPFSRIKVVMSGTEWDNFEWLRDDPSAAQPEIVDLTRKIKLAKAWSKPLILKAGWLHAPYITRVISSDGNQITYLSEGQVVSKEDAIKISASCNAQASYRKLDTSMEKAKDIYEKLFNGPKPHLSPTEHVAIAMEKEKVSILGAMFPNKWEEGVSHMDRDYNLWSGNLKGFIQYRKLIENNFNIT